MTQHSGPDFKVPEQGDRCQAIVKGQPNWNWQWMRVDHQCPKTANQGRDGKLVCHVHARAKTIYRYREVNARLELEREIGR